MGDAKSSWLLVLYGLLAVLGGVLGGVLSAPVWQWAHTGQVREVRPNIEAETFKLVDKEGGVRAALTFDDDSQPRLILYDENGGTLAYLYGGGLEFPSRSGSGSDTLPLRASLDADTGSIELSSPGSIGKVTLAAGDGSLELRNGKGNAASLSAEESWLTFAGENGSAILSLGDVNSLQELVGKSGGLRRAEFDPSVRDYSRLDSTTGSFLISVQGVKSYADGCKVALDIGNLTTATYKGFTMHAGWGQRNPMEKEEAALREYPKWLGSLKEKNISFADELRPATWNRVELVLPSTKPEDFGYLELSNLETNTVSFLRGAPR